jgi:hypothetical protein
LVIARSSRHPPYPATSSRPPLSESRALCLLAHTESEDLISAMSSRCGHRQLAHTTLNSRAQSQRVLVAQRQQSSRHHWSDQGAQNRNSCRSECPSVVILTIGLCNYCWSLKISQLRLSGFLHPLSMAGLLLFRTTVPLANQVIAGPFQWRAPIGAPRRLAIHQGFGTQWPLTTVVHRYLLLTMI